MLDIIRSNDTKAIDKLLRARSTTLAEAEAVVRPILEDIRRRGDRALLRYAKKFDRLDLPRLASQYPAMRFATPIARFPAAL